MLYGLVGCIDILYGLVGRTENLYGLVRKKLFQKVVGIPIYYETIMAKV